MIPIIPKSSFKSGHQHERLADLVVTYFKDFDVICLQEVWGIFTSELKECLICYAQKAGFFYQACQPVKETRLNSRYVCDSGLFVLSRFPLVKQTYHKFSYGVFSDNEAKRGVLFAQIEVAPGAIINLFNLHVQSNSTLHSSDKQYHVTEVREVAFKELTYFIEEVLLSEYKQRGDGML